jgi:hypothetical protein
MIHFRFFLDILSFGGEGLDLRRRNVSNEAKP